MIVDTDVFVCDLGLLPQDAARTSSSTAFLGCVGDPWTTVFNILEATGVVAHHVPPRDIWSFFEVFCDRYGVRVWHPAVDLAIAEHHAQSPFWSGVADVICRKIHFRDAVTIHCAELAGADTIVTWNIKHFRRCTALPVLTPEEYLTQPS